MCDEANLSMEHIMASELYPKKALVSDDDNLQVPFPVLPGESVEYLGRTDGGVIALSNFRLFIRFKEAFINIPLGVIETVEYRDIFFINFFCKDAHSLRCTFPTNERCLEWYKRLVRATQPPKKLQDVFAFAFHAWCSEPDSGRQGALLEHGLAYQLCGAEDLAGGYSFGREVERLGFDLKSAWRICYINEDYKVCPSYPRLHIVPACMTDREIRTVANFRASHRFPSIMWRDRRSGAVLARSSQPEVGWLGWRNVEDERLLQAVSAACALDCDTSQPKLANGHASESVVSEKESGPKKLLIIDARSYTAAWANRAKGGGCECIEYYPNSEIQFMSLANIHTVRKSFYAVRGLCVLGPDQPNWLTNVENTKWLSYIGLLLRSALLIVNAIDKEGRPVLVHCSDGWDRTPQLVALAELMLDSYYRTVEGFRVLVEREWLDFGHKFADRCGNAMTCEDLNERCPVFLQWLDCVHQLLIQFPCAFQFNEAFLVKLAHHTYSNLFGTFLCNSPRERQEGKVPEQTSSVWSLLQPHNRPFVNLLYKPDMDQVLRPSYHIRHVRLWQAVFLSETAPSASEDLLDIDEDAADSEGGTEVLGGPDGQHPAMTKTRSCDNISAALDSAVGSLTAVAVGGVTDANKLQQRRLSDPQLLSDSANSLLVQSTESLTTGTVATVPAATMETTTSSNETQEKDASLSKDFEHSDVEVMISNGISSETLTEVSELCSVSVAPSSPSVMNGDDKLGHATASENNTGDLPKDTQDNESLSKQPHLTNGDLHEASEVLNGDSSKHLSEISNNIERPSGDLEKPSKDVGETTKGQDSGQYGISLIDSPETEESSSILSLEDDRDDVTGTTLINGGGLSRLNGFLCHINGSTDTLTGGELTDTGLPLSSSPRQQHEFSPLSSSPASSRTSQHVNGNDHHSAITINNKHSATSNNNSKSLSVNGVGPSLQDAADSENNHQHRTLRNGHVPDSGSHSNGRTAVAPPRLEDVLSKLNLQSLLDSSEAPVLDLACLSRGSSASRDDGVESCFSCHSRTPNCSTGPPTPGTELKSCPWYPRHQSSLARHLDSDGLTSHVDPVQLRLSQIQADYQHRINQLSQQLQLAKAIIYQWTTVSTANGASRHGDNADDMLSTESADSGEHGSMGAGSTAASDVSWEQVEERDAQMTLWVPDHAVTHCGGCNQEFWIVRRKHHCRSCGQVFCNECTKNVAPLPEQQLAKPQRVCVKCYQALSSDITALSDAQGGLLDTLATMATMTTTAAIGKEDGAFASC